MLVFIKDFNKDEILNSSLMEFAEHGYERANTNRICKEAGVSKGLIFHYFGSKQKLYSASVGKCIDYILAYFKSLNVEEGDFASTMLSYYRYRAKFFYENPVYYKMLMQATNNTPKEIRPEVDTRLKEVNDLAIGTLLKHFEKLPLKVGVDREMALSLIIAVFGIIEGKYEHNEIVEKECCDLIRLVLYGISSENF